jgi:positive regulator of sigma E activity
MKERGIVTKRDGRDVTVRLQIGDGCGSCACSGACQEGKNEAKVYDKRDIQPGIGDTVEVEVTAGKQLSSAFLLLVLPLAFFASGYAAGLSLFPKAGEGPAALMGVLGIALGVLAGSSISRLGRQESMPYISRTLMSPVSGSENH